MLRVIATYLVVLFGAPGLGVLVARGVAGEGTRFLGAPSASVARSMCTRMPPDSPAAVQYACEFVSSARVIELGLLATAGVMVLLLVAINVAIATLGRPRDRLARYFPAVVRTSLATLVLVFVAQGGLLLWTLWEMAMAGQGNTFTLPLLLFAAGLIVAAVGISWSWRKLFTVVPLVIRGIVADRDRFAALWGRIESLAARLGALPPHRLILGLEPTAFVTRSAIELRGTGSLPEVETLYLPISGLRVWSETELDAVIGHELGHFRGEDLRYSERLAPALRSLAVSLESVRRDPGEQSGWFGLARVPAQLVLTGLLVAFRALIATAARERELAADQAAVSVSGPAPLLGALAKISVLSAEWGEFWRALAHFVTVGHTRANSCEDFLDRVSMLSQRISPDRLAQLLLILQQPHPFDTHPQLAVRAAALGVDPAPILRASTDALLSRVEAAPTQRAPEEEVSAVIAESVRLPGRELEVDSTVGLPSALAPRILPSTSGAMRAA